MTQKDLFDPSLSWPRQKEFLIEGNLDTFAELYDLAPVGCLRLNKGGLIQEINRAGQVILAMERDDLLNRPLFAFVVEEDRAIWTRYLERLFERAEVSTCEIRLFSPGGYPAWVQLIGQKLPSRRNKSDQAQLVLFDISGHKRIEEALTTRLHYEERLAACFQTLLTATPAAITDMLYQLLTAFDISRIYIAENFTGPNGGLFMRWTHEVCNPSIPSRLDTPATQKISYNNGLGRWSEELSRGVPIIGPLPAAEQSLLIDRPVQSLLILPLWVAGEWYGFISFEDLFQRRVWDEADILLLQTAAEMIGSFIERRRTEEALRRSEARFRSYFELGLIGVAISSPDKRLLQVNDRLGEILGYSPEELLSLPWPALSHPDDLAMSEIEFERLLSGKIDTYRLDKRFLRKDGSVVYTNMAVRCLRQSDGTVDYAVVFVQDITERKLAEEELRRSKEQLEQTLLELKATQYQVLQQERLAAVGQLAAGIAHDFNNILTSIIDFAELARMEPELAESVKNDLGRVVHQAQRGAGLVRQVLDFARQSVSKKKLVDLATLVQDVVKLLRETMPEQIRLSLEIEPGNYRLEADPLQLQQVLTNLASNARDAMPKGGTLVIRLDLQTLTLSDSPPGFVWPQGESWPADWVVLSVTDSGVGIPAEVQPHIFEPFFTTKEVGQGVGLGLAQVYGIMQQHHGWVEVESRSGQGAVFRLYLPLLAIELAPAFSLAPVQPVEGHGEIILVVEDDAHVADVAEMMLTRLGYQALRASGGREALAIYERRQAYITLVLTDILMPDIDGGTLARALLAQNPGVKVIALSGYAPPPETEDLSIYGLVDWLQKPLNLEQLAAAIRRALRTP